MLIYFRKMVEVYKKWGLKGVIRSIVSHFRYLILYYYLRIRGEDFVRLKDFSSEDPGNVFDFIREEFLGIFKPQQKRGEFVELLKIFKAASPKRIMEIGTAQGGSLFCFCKLAPKEAEIISIDLPPLATDKYLRQFFKLFPKKGQKIHLLKVNSHKKKTIKRVKKILNGKQLDFLFIDADHSYKGVKKDFENYFPLLRPGGIIAFHDIYTAKGVKKFWNEIKNKFNHKEIHHNRNANIGIIYL